MSTTGPQNLHANSQQSKPAPMRADRGLRIMPDSERFFINLPVVLASSSRSGSPFSNLLGYRPDPSSRIVQQKAFVFFEFPISNLQSRFSMANMSDIRNGLTFRLNGDIWSITEFQHVKQGRGAAFVRAKMKSLTTGKVIENTFNKSSRIDEIRVERRKYQYLYDDGSSLVVMDTDTYEQININGEMVDNRDLLTEGEMVDVLFNTEDSTPLTVELPQYVIREIEYTEPGIKGDTATNTLKPATLVGGAEVRVPLFINIGDKVKVDTTSKAYVERVKA